MNVAVTIAVWCESIRPGCEFRAQITTGGGFYGGTGRTAFEAIAWSLDEYVSRGLRGDPHRMARDPRDVPGARAREPESFQLAATIPAAARAVTRAPRKSTKK